MLTRRNEIKNLGAPGDVNLTRQVGGHMVLRKGEVEIRNSGLTSAVRTGEEIGHDSASAVEMLVDRSNSRASRCQFPKLPLAVLFMMMFLASAVSSAGTSKLYPPKKDEAGALRLAQGIKKATPQGNVNVSYQRQQQLGFGLEGHSSH